MRRTNLFVISAIMLVTSVGGVFAQEATAPVKESGVIENVIENKDYSNDFDTGIFEGKATYLLQDTFPCTLGGTTDNKGRPSGWDIDLSGGTSGSRDENAEFYITDVSKTQAVTLSHELMPHKDGILTFESAFDIVTDNSNGYYYELSGDAGTIFRIETLDGKLMLMDKAGQNKYLDSYTKNRTVHIKVLVDPAKKESRFIINNKDCGKFAFQDLCTEVNRIELGVTKDGTLSVILRFVNVYINYIVNERFLTTPVGATPYDWSVSGYTLSSAVTEAGGQSYPDIYSYRVSDETTLVPATLKKSFDKVEGKLVTEFTVMLPDSNNAVNFSVGEGDKVAVGISAKNRGLPQTGRNFIQDIITTYGIDLKS